LFVKGKKAAEKKNQYDVFKVIGAYGGDKALPPLSMLATDGNPQPPALSQGLDEGLSDIFYQPSPLTGEGKGGGGTG